MSDPEARRGRRFEDWLDELLEADVDGVMVREKSLEDGALLELAQAARLRFAGRSVWINGRPDVALAAGADGVHLPADGLPVAAVRSAFAELLVGRSTHHEDEVVSAAREGADSVTFGPVFFTPSKAAFGPPRGLAELHRAAQHGIAVLALGGIRPEALEPIAEAGAWGVAGIGAFHDSKTLARLVDARRRAWPS